MLLDELDVLLPDELEVLLPEELEVLLPDELEVLLPDDVGEAGDKDGAIVGVLLAFVGAAVALYVGAGSIERKQKRQ